MHKMFLPLILLSVPILGGCATLLRGTHQTMSFHTIPVGAQVMVDGKVYTSPISLSLTRKETHQIMLAMKGYLPISFAIDPQWDGVSLIGNMIIPGGSVGLVADHLCGADMSFCELAEIKMIPTTRPSPTVVVLNDFKGHLLTNSELDRAVVADRHDRSQFFRGQP